MKRKISIILASCLLMAGILGGCGNSQNGNAAGGQETADNQAAELNQEKDEQGTETSAAETEAAMEDAGNGEEVTITLIGWEASALETEAINNGIAQFEEANPGIKVNYTTVPSGTSYSAKLLSSAASGTLPDVMFMESMSYRTFAYKDTLMDLTDKFDADFALDDFVESSQGIMDVDGKVYGVSSSSVIPIVFYNRDLFDAAGIPYPSTNPADTWTIEEFRDIAKKLTNEDTYGVYGLENAGMWPALTNANGGGYFNEDYTASAFNCAENKQVFEMIKALRVEDKSAPVASILDSVGMSDTQMLANGKIAMLLDGSWSLQELATLDFNCGMAPLPRLTDGPSVSSAQAHLYCISKTSEHPQEAWKLIQFLCSIDFQKSLVSSGLWLPNRHSLYTEEGVEGWYNEEAMGEDYRAMVGYFESAKADERPFQITSKCTDIINEEMGMFFQEDADLDTALANVEERMNEAIKEAQEELK